MENNELINLKKLINRLEKRQIKLLNLICEKKQLLINNCSHKETKIINDYISGSYYNKSEYIKYTICKICEKEINKKITYGSFE
jgi:hypothetical protein